MVPSIQYSVIQTYPAPYKLSHSKLVVRTAKCFAVRNPRLGEYVVSDETGEELSRKIHEIHYGLSKDLGDRFYHAVAAEMPSETNEVALELLGRGTVSEDLRIGTKARWIIDYANDTKGSDKLVEMGLNLGHTLGQRKLILGDWDQMESIGDIRLRRQRVKTDKPMNEWREMSGGYITSLARCNYEDAREYLNRLKVAAKDIEGRLPVANHL